MYTQEIVCPRCGKACFTPATQSRVGMAPSLERIFAATLALRSFRERSTPRDLSNAACTRFPRTAAKVEAIRSPCEYRS